MKVLVTGASGFIGSRTAAVLRTAGHEVVPVDRRHGYDFARLRAPADWRALLTGVDAAINCVGIIAETRNQRFAVLHEEAPRALFRACAERGVRRVVQVSALGADERAVTRYHKSKRAADDELRGLPLDWLVLRPSLVYGEGGTSTALFRRLAALPLIPLIGGGRQRIQPVHVDDLVRAIITGLTAPTRQTIDVVGPAAMTFADWLARLRRRDGRGPLRVVPVPLGLVAAVARCVHPLVPTLHPDNLTMLEQGSTGDVAPFAAFLGRPPRDVP